MRRRIFVLGDSISIQYGPFLKKILEDRFEYDRKRPPDMPWSDLCKPVGANGGDSFSVLRYLEEMTKKGSSFDILVMNCGLHDIKSNMQTNERQVNIETYQINLAEIVQITKRLAKDAVWVTTTPVDYSKHSQHKEFSRYDEDVIKYNSTAADVMEKNNIKVIDLYHFTLSLDCDLHYDGVHFFPSVSKLQAAFIAGYLMAFYSDKVVYDNANR